MVGSKIDPYAVDFLSAYIYPWFNVFSFSVGFFTVAICGFLAAVYLIGEAEKEHIQAIFIKKSKLLSIASIISEGLLFRAAEWDAISLLRELLLNPITLMILLSASVSLIFLWINLEKGKAILVKLLAGVQITLILFAFGFHFSPDFIVIKGGENISLYFSATMGKPMDT